MNCPNCGTSNPDSASICAQCGRPMHAPPPPPTPAYAPPPPPAGSYAPPQYAMPAGGTPPPNYLILSIFTTLCCCLPLGIVGIIFAAQVNSKFAAGDYAGAQMASANAKKWSLIGIVVGLLAQIIWIVFAGGAAILEGISAGMAG